VRGCDPVHTADICDMLPSGSTTSNLSGHVGKVAQVPRRVLASGNIKPADRMDSGRREDRIEHGLARWEATANAHS
jgi:hypothetical protein